MPDTKDGATKSGAKKSGARKTARKTSGAMLKIKQVRSGIGRPEMHLRTLKALGLRYHQHVTEVPDSPAVWGMLFQVRHLVEIQN